MHVNIASNGDCVPIQAGRITTGSPDKGNRPRKRGNGDPGEVQITNIGSSVGVQGTNITGASITVQM